MSATQEQPEIPYLEVNRGQLLDIMDQHHITLPLEAWKYPTVNLREKIRDWFKNQHKSPAEQAADYLANIPEDSVVFWQGKAWGSGTDTVVLDRRTVRLLLATLHLTEKEGRLSGSATPQFILQRIQTVMQELGAKRPSATHALTAFQLGGLSMLAMKCQSENLPVSWG